MSKPYLLDDRPQDRLKQRRFWRLGKNYAHEFWALPDASFEARKGKGIGRRGNDADKDARGRGIRPLPGPLRVLTLEQVVEIDRALEEVGPFGEVRLIKAKGKVRFIQCLESRELPAGGQSPERL